MIVIEFVIFVVSSGLFCSESFRHRLWAVIVAGAVATGSSLLFGYDLVERLLVHTEAPILDPVWTVGELTLEDVVLEYMSNPAAARPALEVLR